MIARVWRGAVRAGSGDAYAAYLDATGVREIRATPGNRGVLLLRRDEPAQTEFTFISLWDSLEAIHRFAGDNVELARYYPQDREFLLHLEPTVTHHTVVVAP